MEMRILEEKRNELLKRREFLVEIIFEGPIPKKEEVKELFVAQKNVKKELTIVKKILGKFGKQEAKAKIFVYDNQETMKAIESKYVLKRNKVIEVKE